MAGKPLSLIHICGQTIPLGQGFGEGTVVDLPAAAGGAALLEQGGPAVVEVCQAEDFGGSPDEGLGDIVTVPGDYPVPLALRRDPGGGEAAKELGADGDLYLIHISKTRTMEELVQDYELTRRETEILGLVFQDLNNEEILDRLHISRHTLLKHLQNLYRKCGVSSRWDLLKLRP